MKVLTILGTRPEIIRLSRIIDRLDRASIEHVIAHTGQNYDPALSDIFFRELNIRTPDYHLHLGGHTFGMQVGEMFSKVEDILVKECPDKVLVLGDTNSALCAILAERKGIPVYHMEAGNRCYDRNVPEEINRKVIDAVCSYNIPYTPGSRENLLREGLHPHRVWVSGNPIYEVLQHYESRIDESKALEHLGLASRQYFLVTIHRAENVDSAVRVKNIFEALGRIADRYQYPVMISVHPRTKERLRQFGVTLDHPKLRFHEPFGFFDFVQLQRHALCVLTDSGTVQEESCLFRVPTVTVRQSTERPETITCGSNALSGVTTDAICDCVDLMVQSPRSWNAPEGYEDNNVSTKLVQFLLGGLSYV